MTAVILAILWVGLLAVLLRRVSHRRAHATAVRRALEFLQRENDLELWQVPAPWHASEPVSARGIDPQPAPAEFRWRAPSAGRKRSRPTMSRAYG